MRFVYLVPGNSEGAQEWIWLPADLISPSFYSSLFHLQVLQAMSATVCSFSLLYGFPWATYNYPNIVESARDCKETVYPWVYWLTVILGGSLHFPWLVSTPLTPISADPSLLNLSTLLSTLLLYRSASGEHNVRQQASLRTNIYRKLTFSRPILAIANILSHWLPPKRYISTILTLETLKLQKRKTSSCT